MKMNFKSQISNLKSQVSSCTFLYLTLAAASLAVADRPPSTDDQLRDSLNSKAGDDYDRELLGDPPKNLSKNRNGPGTVEGLLGGSRTGSKSTEHAGIGPGGNGNAPNGER